MKLIKLTEVMPAYLIWIIAVVLLIFVAVSVYGRINLKFGSKIFSRIDEDKIRSDYLHIIKYTVIPSVICVILMIVASARTINEYLLVPTAKNTNKKTVSPKNPTLHSVTQEDIKAGVIYARVSTEGMSVQRIQNRLIEDLKKGSIFKSYYSNIKIRNDYFIKEVDRAHAQIEKVDAAGVTGAENFVLGAQRRLDQQKTLAVLIESCIQELIAKIDANESGVISNKEFNEIINKEKYDEIFRNRKRETQLFSSFAAQHSNMVKRQYNIKNSYFPVKIETHTLTPQEREYIKHVIVEFVDGTYEIHQSLRYNMYLYNQNLNKIKADTSIPNKTSLVFDSMDDFVEKAKSLEQDLDRISEKIYIKEIASSDILIKELSLDLKSSISHFENIKMRYNSGERRKNDFAALKIPPNYHSQYYYSILQRFESKFDILNYPHQDALKSHYADIYYIDEPELLLIEKSIDLLFEKFDSKANGPEYYDQAMCRRYYVQMISESDEVIKRARKILSNMNDYELPSVPNQIPDDIVKGQQKIIKLKTDRINLAIKNANQIKEIAEAQIADQGDEVILIAEIKMYGARKITGSFYEKMIYEKRDHQAKDGAEIVSKYVMNQSEKDAVKDIASEIYNNVAPAQDEMYDIMEDLSVYVQSLPKKGSVEDYKKLNKKLVATREKIKHIYDKSIKFKNQSHVSYIRQGYSLVKSMKEIGKSYDSTLEHMISSSEMLVDRNPDEGYKWVKRSVPIHNGYSMPRIKKFIKLRDEMKNTYGVNEVKD